MNRNYSYSHNFRQNQPDKGRVLVLLYQILLVVIFGSSSFLSAIGLATTIDWLATENSSPDSQPAAVNTVAEEHLTQSESPISKPIEDNQEPVDNQPVSLPEPPVTISRIDDRYDHIAQEIKDLANQLELTDRAKEIFYDHDPQILDNENDPDYSCRSSSADVVVYGCWQTGHIDVLRTPSLKTTTVHELLHAVYYELYINYRSEDIDPLLDDFKRDHPELTAEFLDIYEGHYNYEDEETRRWAERSEIHSFIGSQVAELPAALEEHYGRYFHNRAKIVDFYEAWLESLDRKQEASEQVNQLVGDQDGEYQTCVYDLNSFAGCSQFETDRVAYQAYADCLTSHKTSFDDCQALQPAFIPYASSTQRGSP